MNTDWCNWLNDNLENGCNPAEVVDIMLKNNFSKEAVIANIDNSCLFNNYPLKRSRTHQNNVENPEFYQKLANVSITTHPRARSLEDSRIQLHILDNFLTEDECDQLIAKINPVLYPSTVTISNGDDKFRTSKTSELRGENDAFIQKIEQKIADTLGCELAYSEPMQAQRYDIGNEFKAHTDYFEPNTDEFKTFAGQHGQRTWTFMIYLNNTPKGGGTNFVRLGTTFYPRKGQAVIWNNLHPDGRPNDFTLHHGMPVEEGEKIIITKWFRDKPSRELWND